MGFHLFRCIQGQYGFASLKGNIAKLIHFRLFSALGEQAFQIGKRELVVRIKLVGVHVLPHALDELSHLGFATKSDMQMSNFPLSTWNSITSPNLWLRSMLSMTCRRGRSSLSRRSRING